MTGFLLWARLPGVIHVYPHSGMGPEKDGEPLPKKDLFWKLKLTPYTLQYSVGVILL